jgi:hypothetical protein
MKKTLVSMFAASMASVCLVAPAFSQAAPNTILSNTNGYNNINPPGLPGSPSVSIPGIAGFNPATLGLAQSLSAKLAAAQAAVDKAAGSGGDGVRRFARLSNKPCNCGGGAEQAELNKVKAEVAAFLEGTKTPTAGQLGEAKPTGGAPAAASGPAW